MSGRNEHSTKMEVRTLKLLDNAPMFLSDYYLYLNYMQPRSRHMYVYQVCKYLYYCSERQDVLFSKLSPEEICINIDSYLFDCKTKPDGSPATIAHLNQVSAILCNLFLFLRKRGFCAQNPMEDKRSFRGDDNVRRVPLTKKDFEKILCCAKDDRWNKYKSQDIAILSLLMSTGMRITALTEIDLSDIDFANSQLRVFDKGQKIHVYVLSKNVSDYLKQWVEERSCLAVDTEALFISPHTKCRASSFGINRVVKKYSEMALGKVLTAHKLRAGLCTILYKETKDVDFVREVIGHSELSTTLRYIVCNGDSRKKAVKMLGALL